MKNQPSQHAGGATLHPHSEPDHQITPEHLVARDPTRGVPFQIGDWVIAPPNGTITRAGRSTHLEPRVMHVLCILASRPGQVLSREGLLDEVWPNTFVNEDALTRAVSDIRRAMEDDPRDPRIIATVPKRGYRLLLNPRAVSPRRGSLEPVPTQAMAAAGPTTKIPAFVRSLALVAGVCGLATVIVVLSFALGKRAPLELIDTAVGGRPLTSNQGSEGQPAITADGQLVAYSHSEPGEQYAQIYVTTLGTEAPLCVTEGGGPKTSPAWSADGLILAYFELRPDHRRLMTVALVGGIPKRLTTLAHGPDGLDWSPDGRYLSYALWDDSADRTRLELYDMETFSQLPLPLPPPGIPGDKLPTFSPDGRWLAFVRTNSALLDEIHVMPSQGGETRRVNASPIRVFGLDWWPDSAHLVYSASPEGSAALWTVSVAGGDPRWLPTSSQLAIHPTVAATAGTLVFEIPSVRSGIHEISLSADEDFESRPLIDSNRQDLAGKVSPDGTRLAFVSDRSGHQELWIADRDGANPRQLSDFGGPIILAPHWSPGGQSIAVSVKLGEHFAIHVVKLDGSPPLRLTTASTHEIVRYWSRRDHWITYKTDRSGSWQFERIDPATGELAQGLPVEQRMLREAPDGSRVFFLHGHPCRICSRPVDGGEMMTHVDDALDLDNTHPFVPLSDGILYFRPADGQRELVFQEFTSRQRRVLARFAPGDGSHPSVTPDGRSLLIDRVSFSSDLVLVESTVN